MPYNLKKMSHDKFHYDPRFFFMVFLIDNIALAYLHLAIEVKIWIGVVSLLFPFFIALVTVDPAGPYEYLFDKAEEHNPLIVWLLPGVFGLGVFLRLFRFVSLQVWPMWDDAYNSLLSIWQMEHWSWHLTYTIEKVPPLMYWLQALFLRLFGPSLFSIWFLPVLLSLLIVPLGYWTCRQYGTRTFSILAGTVLSLSFWPLFLKAFYLAQGIVIWQLVSFGILGVYLKSLGTKYEKVSLFVLGICLGSGFYIYITALPTICAISMVILWNWVREIRRGLNTLLLFFLPMGVASIPILGEVLKYTATGHAHEYCVFYRHYPLLQQMSVSLSYGTALLWGTFDKSGFNFGPIWGGFLNPILGSAFLLGLIDVFRFRKRPIFYWMLGMFVICFLPGVLSNSIEMMRVLPVFPFVILLVVIGLFRFIEPVSINKRTVLLIFILFGSTFLDLYHLWGPYHQWAIPNKYMDGSKSPEHYQAYQILEKIKEKGGPGLIFSDLYFDVFDQSLYATTYGFNAAINPALVPEKARWAAIILNINDRLLLLRQFPMAIIYDIGVGLKDREDRMLMAVLPVTKENQKLLFHWMKVQQRIQALFPDIPYHILHANYKEMLFNLWDIYFNSCRDPFLSRCVIERIVLCLSQSDDGSYSSALMRIPIQELKLSPSVNFNLSVIFHRLGKVFENSGDYSSARECFNRAAYLNPEYPKEKMISRLTEEMSKKLFARTKSK